MQQVWADEVVCNDYDRIMTISCFIVLMLPRILQLHLQSSEKGEVTECYNYTNLRTQAENSCRIYQYVWAAQILLEDYQRPRKTIVGKQAVHHSLRRER